MEIPPSDYERLMAMEINELNIQLEMAVLHDGYVRSASELPNISSKEYELKKSGSFWMREGPRRRSAAGFLFPEVP